MVKELPRKCSFCGQHGHNSRTCNNNKAVPENYNNNNGSKGPCFKLFGVNILEESVAADSMKKSQSMGNLARACEQGMIDAAASSDHESGYLSDGVIQNKRRKAAHERKRGTPWTEEEHRTFLAGLNDLGKGDWRGISMKYVPTRTPTQVASHAQKYFLRQQASNDKKKRRSSLFDMPYRPEDVDPQRYPITSMMKSASQVATTACGSQALPGNSSHEIMSRFPHLCLDNFMVPVRPVITAQTYPIPYPYPYSVGPINVQPWMMNYGISSYMYNVPNNFPMNNSNNNASTSFAPVVVPHPSGIPQPRSTPSSPSIGKRDSLELKIGQPQSKQGSGPSSPSSGAIRVT